MERETIGTAFLVTDASGETYVTIARDFGEAYRKFTEWEAGENPDPGDLWEPPQSIQRLGPVIITPAIAALIAGEHDEP